MATGLAKGFLRPERTLCLPEPAFAMIAPHWPKKAEKTKRRIIGPEALVASEGGALLQI
jgi:hypothetical protein